MAINYYYDACQLLKTVAISVHERRTKETKDLCFNSRDIYVVEEWLRKFSMNFEKPDSGGNQPAFGELYNKENSMKGQ